MSAIGRQKELLESTGFGDVQTEVRTLPLMTVAWMTARARARA